MSQMGHFRQIDPLPTLWACPLRSDRVRTFAPQQFDAVCQKPTNANETIAALQWANGRNPQFDWRAPGSSALTVVANCAAKAP
jgi:hypothetical protein